ncbi:MAG: hypothetical protein AAF483_22840 [Planctomycetota bacterium]
MKFQAALLLIAMTQYALCFSQEIGGEHKQVALAFAGSDKEQAFEWISVSQDSEGWTYYLTSSEVSCGQFRSLCPEIFAKLDKPGPDPWTDDYPIRGLDIEQIQVFIDELQKDFKEGGQFPECDSEFSLPGLKHWKEAALAIADQQHLTRWSWSDANDKALDRQVLREQFIKPSEAIYDDSSKPKTVSEGKEFTVDAPVGIEIIGARSINAARVKHDLNQITYTPPATFHGTDYVHYEYRLTGVDDWVGESEFRITVSDDRESTQLSEEDGYVTNPLIGLDLSVKTLPSFGSVAPVPESGVKGKKFKYTPEPGRFGKVSFTISDKDGNDRNFTATIHPPFVDQTSVKVSENSPEVVIGVFNPAIIDSFEGMQISCASKTKLDGELSTDERYLFRPNEECKNKIVELRSADGNVLQYLAVQAKVIECSINEPVQIEIGERLDVPKGEGERFEEKQIGKDNDRQRKNILYYTPTQVGPQSVRYQMAGAEREKLLFVNDANRASQAKLRVLSDSKPLLIEQKFESLSASTGSLVKIPVLIYKPPQDTVTSGRRELLNFSLIMAGSETEFQKVCEITSSDGALLASKLLPLWGYKKKTHELDRSGVLSRKSTVSPAEWLFAVRGLSSDGNLGSKALNLIVESLDDGNESVRKLAKEALQIFLDPMIKRSSGQSLVLQPINANTVDENLWGFRFFHGNVPEIVMKDNDAIVKGATGRMSEPTHYKKLLISDPGISLADTKGIGFRLMRRSRIGENWYGAIINPQINVDEIRSRAAFIRLLAKARSESASHPGDSSDSEANRVFFSNPDLVAAFVLGIHEHQAGGTYSDDVASDTMKLGEQLDEIDPDSAKWLREWGALFDRSELR